jgi:hypothetical protein
LLTSSVPNGFKVRQGRAGSGNRENGRGRSGGGALVSVAIQSKTDQHASYDLGRILRGTIRRRVGLDLWNSRITVGFRLTMRNCMLVGVSPRTTFSQVNLGNKNAGIDPQ